MFSRLYGTLTPDGAREADGVRYQLKDFEVSNELSIGMTRINEVQESAFTNDVA